MTARRALAALGVFGRGRAALAGVLAAGGALAWVGADSLAAVLEEQSRHESEARRAADKVASATEHAAFTKALLTRQSREIEIARGESLALALSRAGIAWSDINPAVAGVNEVFNPRRMRPGEPVRIYYEQVGADVRLTGFAFRSDPGEAVTVSRLRDGRFTAREVAMPLRFEMARLTAKVDGSIYQAAIENGATEREVAGLSEAFAYDVDFQREVRPGDEFEMVFGRYADDQGRTVKTGDLLFVSMRTRSGVKSYYRFQGPGDSEPNWYDASGRSSRKFLMRTPVNGARLSSGYGMRRHPILGYSRMHKGIDFAAGAGTPVMAAGDGVVRRASTYGGYGNYIRVSHADGYETAYAHLSRYARGIRPGVRVRQGQIIGYVGSTGRSTGPHLHYEVMQRGRQVNPLSLKARTGRNLSGESLRVFEAAKREIDLMREPNRPATLLASASTPQAAQAGAGGTAAR